MHGKHSARWRTKLGSLWQRISVRWRAWCRRLAAQAGQTLAEYAMLLGGLTAAVLLSVLLIFQTGITSSFSSASNCVQGTCDDDLGGDDDDGGDEEGDEEEEGDHDDDD